jgi:hypothetical protein
MNRPIDFSRRDFLKASGAGLLGFFLADTRVQRALAADVPKQGRMTLSGINLYQEPSFNAKKLHIYGRDEVVGITAGTDGDPGNTYNRTWYELNGEGYTYSGWVQPVETNYQQPVFEIPGSGQLGELTVPFSDTRREPSAWADRAYRIYYATTHWVTGISVNRYEKTIWYVIHDSKLGESFHVPAQDMRLVPPEELSLLSPEVSEADKHIYVDLPTQSVTAFEGTAPVLVARCASGGKGTRTPVGTFHTYHKGPSIHMSNDGEAGAGRPYDLPGVPWVSFFTGTGISFHGTYWHNDYGQPRSHGCVNLTPADAKFIYRWSRPKVPPETQYLHLPGEGTLVQIVNPA